MNLYVLTDPSLVFPEIFRFQSLQQMVEAYTEHVISLVKGNNHLSLAGWSSGGVVAYEVACRLQALGYCTERVILIDTYAPATYDVNKVSRYIASQGSDVSYRRILNSLQFYQLATFKGQLEFIKSTQPQSDIYERFIDDKYEADALWELTTGTTMHRYNLAAPHSEIFIDNVETTTLQWNILQNKKYDFNKLAIELVRVHRNSMEILELEVEPWTLALAV